MTAANAASDGSFYDDPSSVDAYLQHRHSAVSSPNRVMEEPAFTDVAGELAKKAILDLGCGDGLFAQTCVAAGCDRFVGVDSSAPMIDRARERAGSGSTSFEVASIEDFAAPAASFDLVTSRMALHYVHDLDPVFTSVHRMLRPGGRLIFSVVHPIITSSNTPPTGARTTMTVDSYFVAGPREREWFGRPVTWQHRPIEEYIRVLTRAGFSIETLRECAPVEQLFEGDAEEYERRQRVPVFLLIAASPNTR